MIKKKMQFNNIYKSLFILQVLLLTNSGVKAQCPSDLEDLFNYVAVTNEWRFCENMGAFDLTEYLNPDYPVGTFSTTNPSITINNNVFNVADGIGETSGVPIEYNVTIGGVTCTVQRTFFSYTQSPTILPGSVQNLNQIYCTSDVAFSINPVIAGPAAASAALFINGGVEQSLPYIYNPSAVGIANDEIEIIYGADCLIREIFTIEVIDAPTLNNPDTIYTTETAYVLQATPPNGNFFMTVNGSPLAGSIIDASTFTAGTVITVDYDLNGCSAVSESIIIADEPEVLPPDTILPVLTKVFIPNVFTPNEDSLHDKVFVRADTLHSMHFKVFDRWGAKVFETQTQTEAWEGYNEDGLKLKSGVYFYQLNYKIKETDAEQLKKGEITLIR